MVSSKERLRLAAQFDQAQKAINNQKASITRLTLMLTEASAALFEIAKYDEDGMPSPTEWDAGTAADRAQAALDRMEVIRSSGNNDDGEESTQPEEGEQGT